ncbi:hypothetical protein BKA67DRAFT_541792 [Truncatella angustata]|uniref:Uncharacterized protein n=1 Tax=Truncatella angustata TaxID=152316 RepID=A0A9P8RLU2_9PEZI|nr:uncharacterized protein BKA67DRAFT_541792 [Truncatella angustata]KAH6645595.1 hypothetical protein BKA67DRAFT_541792 [Truncatella angustata]
METAVLVQDAARFQAWLDGLTCRGIGVMLKPGGDSNCFKRSHWALSGQYLAFFFKVRELMKGDARVLGGAIEWHETHEGAEFECQAVLIVVPRDLAGDLWNGCFADAGYGHLKGTFVMFTDLLYLFSLTEQEVFDLQGETGGPFSWNLNQIAIEGRHGIVASFSTFSLMERVESGQRPFRRRVSHV